MRMKPGAWSVLLTNGSASAAAFPSALVAVGVPALATCSSAPGAVLAQPANKAASNSAAADVRIPICFSGDMKMLFWKE
jgi:hypothetical protein